MGQLAIGSVVLIKFPFADLKNYKKRPAVVVARSSLKTVILCQITSRELPDTPTITIAKNDFIRGGLPVTSYVRPDKLFTVDENIAGKDIAGQLTERKISEAKAEIRLLFA